MTNAQIQEQIVSNYKYFIFNGSKLIGTHLRNYLSDWTKSFRTFTLLEFLEKTKVPIVEDKTTKTEFRVAIERGQCYGTFYIPKTYRRTHTQKGSYALAKCIARYIAHFPLPYKADSSDKPDLVLLPEDMNIQESTYENPLPNMFCTRTQHFIDVNVDYLAHMLLMPWETVSRIPEKKRTVSYLSRYFSVPQYVASAYKKYILPFSVFMA